MVIRVELNRETEARLQAEARLQGVPLESFAERLLKEAARSTQPARKPLTVERFNAMIRALTENSQYLPDLPSESFTRESFYEGR